jgi:hypothetical protein
LQLRNASAQSQFASTQAEMQLLQSWACDGVGTIASSVGRERVEINKFHEDKLAEGARELSTPGKTIVKNL